MSTFNKFQYEDLKSRPHDLYAQAKYTIITNYLSKLKSLSILNVGFGSGELSFLLEKAGHTVTNIEPVGEYIELAKQNVTKQGAKNISFIQSSIENYSTDQHYDCVIATDVLEHIKDDKTAFIKLASFAKPSGLIIITVPAEPILFGYHDKILGHFRRYTLESLTEIMTKDVVIDKSRYYGWTLLPVCFLYSGVLKKPYPIAQTGKNKVVRFMLKKLLQIDAQIDMTSGTSLIVFAHRK